MPSDTVPTVAHIRALLKKYGTKERGTKAKIAHQLDCSKTLVTLVSQEEERFGKAKQSKITLDALGLTKSDGKLCRRCGDPTRIFTNQLLCVECTLVELVRQGIVVLLEVEVEDDGLTP